MAKSMMSYFREEPEMAHRFSQKAIDEDGSIQDFGDFKNALFKAFDTENGQRASKFFEEDEVVFLFKQQNVRDKIERNVGKDRADEIFAVADRSDLIITRAKPVGEKVRQTQVKAYISDKNVKVSSHTWRGKEVEAYARGYAKWSPAQERFLRIRKQQGISSKKIAHQYNQQFKEKRSISSISTKVYRL